MDMVGSGGTGGIYLGFQGMGRREGKLGYCFGAWRALSHVFNLLPWEIQQEKVIFWYSLLGKLPACTSAFLVVQMEAGLNLLHFLWGAPRGCAGRLLQGCCRRVLLFLHFQLLSSPACWTLNDCVSLGNAAFYSTHFAESISFWQHPWVLYLSEEFISLQVFLPGCNINLVGVVCALNKFCLAVWKRLV